MRFTVAAVGRPRDVPMAAAIADYERRAARYWPLVWVEVRESTGGAPEAAREREGSALLKRVGAAVIVACDPRGESLTSQAFAAAMQRWREDARDVAFVLGGAFGLSDDVRARAARLLSLAPWTLPHALARLVLAEQLYRAGTMVRGEPYHK